MKDPVKLPEKKENAALPPEFIQSIQRALAEDIGPGDVTTNSIVPADARMAGRIIAKQSGVAAGLGVARAVFTLLDPSVQVDIEIQDGAAVTNKMVLARIEGPARALLTGERVALNFLGRMSGIATLTRHFVERVQGTKAVILDTRKTAPGLRTIDKLAVRLGGGQNHRTGLYDMILIKDNHIDFAGSLQAAVAQARAAGSGLQIEVETRTLEDVRAALDLGVERILLDNMSCEMLAQAVAMTAGRARLEASGNITLENVREVAETGVDFISIGALTHSVKVFDVSFLYTR
jgi:nicotinate-nucleotide pyrophosphorylase (carboxylating)